jgi:tetratricopeptide (TPR) repeat protein
MARQAHLRAVEDFSISDRPRDRRYAARSLRALAALEASRQNWKAAAHYSRSGSTLAPTLESVRGLVRALRRQGHTIDHVVKELETLRLATDNSVPQLTAFGTRALLDLDEPNAAQRYLNALDPRYSDAALVHAAWGRLLMRLRELAAAREAYLRALDTAPADGIPNREVAAWWSSALGGVERSLGNLDAATAHLERAVESAPNAAAYWYRLGQVYRTRDRLTAARQAFARAVDLRSDFEQAHAALAETEARARRVGSIQGSPNSNSRPSRVLEIDISGSAFHAHGEGKFGPTVRSPVLTQVIAAGLPLARKSLGQR